MTDSAGNPGPNEQVGSDDSATRNKKSLHKLLTFFFHGRPDASELQARNVLVESPDVNANLHAKSRALRRSQTADSLRQRLSMRSTPEELIRRGILPPSQFMVEGAGIPRESNIFGLTPTQLAEKYPNMEGGVPEVLWACAGRILEDVDMEGLFRVSGSKRETNELQHLLETGAAVNVRAVGNVHVLTSFIGTFFRSMPDPLLCFDMYDEWITLSRSIRHGDVTPEVLVSISTLVHKLPRANFLMLRWLLELLYLITLRSSLNKMMARNMGTVFGPTLLRPRVETMDTLALSSANAILVETLVQFFVELFPLNPVEVPPPVLISMRFPMPPVLVGLYQPPWLQIEDEVLDKLEEELTEYEMELEHDEDDGDPFAASPSPPPPSKQSGGSSSGPSRIRSNSLDPDKGAKSKPTPEYGAVVRTIKAIGVSANGDPSSADKMLTPSRPAPAPPEQLRSRSGSALVLDSSEPKKSKSTGQVSKPTSKPLPSPAPSKTSGSKKGKDVSTQTDFPWSKDLLAFIEKQTPKKKPSTASKSSEASKPATKSSAEKAPAATKTPSEKSTSSTKASEKPASSSKSSSEKPAATKTTTDKPAATKTTTDKPAEKHTVSSGTKASVSTRPASYSQKTSVKPAMVVLPQPVVPGPSPQKAKAKEVTIIVPAVSPTRGGAASKVGSPTAKPSTTKSSYAGGASKSHTKTTATSGKTSQTNKIASGRSSEMKTYPPKGITRTTSTNSTFGRGTLVTSTAAKPKSSSSSSLSSSSSSSSTSTSTSASTPSTSSTSTSTTTSLPTTSSTNLSRRPASATVVRSSSGTFLMNKHSRDARKSVSLKEFSEADFQNIRSVFE